MLHHYHFFTGAAVAEPGTVDFAGSADAAGACEASLSLHLGIAAQAEAQALLTGALAAPDDVRGLCFKLRVTPRLHGALHVGNRLESRNLHVQSRITAAVGTTPCR